MSPHSGRNVIALVYHRARLCSGRCIFLHSRLISYSVVTAGSTSCTQTVGAKAACSAGVRCCL
jgi:hypothetical protein